MSYFDAVKATYIENWPPALHEISVPQVDLPLSREETIALGSNIMDYGTTFHPSPLPVEPLRQRVCQAVASFAQGSVVRLGSRSPKDAWGWNRHGPRFPPKTQDPLMHLTDCSERISDDLHLALHHHYQPHIFVRQWQDVVPWQEFRCFQRQGQLVGCSQYHYRLRNPPLNHHTHLPRIRQAIQEFHTNRFAPACHLADVVFDIFALDHDNPTTQPRIILLEINPWGPWTDPCLETWHHLATQTEWQIRTH